MLDAATLDLFERAFGSAQPPHGLRVADVLDAAMKQLQRCKNDPKHSYLAAAGKCPWCQLIAVARLMFFLPGQGAATPFRPEDIDQLIRKLDGMQIDFRRLRAAEADPARPGVAPARPALDREALCCIPSGPARRRSRSRLLPRLPPPPDLLPRPPLKPLPPPAPIHRPSAPPLSCLHPLATAPLSLLARS